MKCTYLSIFLIFNYLINSLGRSGSAVGLSLIEPDVSTERVRSNEFRVCWRGLSLTHCLGDSSEGLLFCGLLKMVTFDGDVGIVFVEAYNYLSELSILARFFCRI